MKFEVVKKLAETSFKLKDLGKISQLDSVSLPSVRRPPLAKLLAGFSLVSLSTSAIRLSCVTTGLFKLLSGAIMVVRN